MCTAMSLQTPSAVLFGRTMDFSHVLAPELFAVPRNFTWKNALNTHQIRDQYCFMGMGQDLPPVLFAEGFNEMGFGVAALYFPGFAHYDPLPASCEKMPALAAVEVVHFLLGMCADVKEAAALLPSLTIYGTQDPITGSVAPLHWIMADKKGGCMVVEKTQDGLHVMENPIGVLTNSPTFSWHLTNLRNYMNVTPGQRQEAHWGNLTLTPFGQGAGGFGLPGDYSPPSRFVKTAFQKSHAEIPSTRDEAVAAWFHIMEGVSIPKGVVETSHGTSDYTQYTSLMDLTGNEYFYRTYEDSRIRSATLPDANWKADSPQRVHIT